MRPPPLPRSLFRVTPRGPPHIAHYRLQGLRAQLGTRLSSTSSSPSSGEPSTSSESPVEIPTFIQPSEDAPELSTEESEKPKTRRARVTTTTKQTEPVELPEDLEVLWDPEEPSEARIFQNLGKDLPPPQVFQDALNNLHLALHPQTQHRATYSNTSESPVEPTLALYCPIEGGEYTIDSTVAELARRTRSELVVLDAAQLAAGEWGQFGKAASSVQLPRNPLHFHASSGNSGADEQATPMEDDNDLDNGSFIQPSQMTLVMAPTAFSSRAILSPPRQAPPPSRIKVFFDALVNTPSKQTSSSHKNRPRLIYIRDFPTLAPSASAWYPSLLSAVRQRRRGPMSRSASPVTSPMVIIFGMAPSIAPPGPTASVKGENESVDWSEDEASEKAREKRLKTRLRKWEKGDGSLLKEISVLTSNVELESGGKKPSIVLLGPGQGAPSALSSILDGLTSIGKSRPAEIDPSLGFFRTSILVPEKRSVLKERDTRVARRREINELTMRMAIGAVGGKLGPRYAVLTPDGSAEERSSHDRLWEDWGKRIGLWPEVKRIADTAMGTFLSLSPLADKVSLEPTLVDWAVVCDAWSSQQSAEEVRKSWAQEAISSAKAKSAEDDERENGTKDASVDELIEQIREDPNPNPHEYRLLPCIVDSASMTTSFSQVHLPPATIDSIRTVVSLPLLHPQAFQYGILKEHGMTGVLLFGPPGTGKTHVVRALAKEAGCRMLVVSPADVMDMYVGEGEKLVKAVFSIARKLSPCVVFLDEIDALFGARISSREGGSAAAHRGVITEFMQEMDGLKSSKNDRVIVIGATNRPFDLDDAVLRRMPRRLLVDLPGATDREEILKILLRDETLHPEVSLQTLAAKTEGFSGSDLKHLCVAAALDAVKEHAHVPWSTSVTSSTAEVSPRPSLAANLQSTTKVPVAEPKERPKDTSSANTEPSQETTVQLIRVICQQNFEKALKEITSSTSEVLGSLAELRKWNEEFGEGKKNKRQQVWGKGSFGFTTYPYNKEDEPAGGKTLHASATLAASRRPNMDNMGVD